jgi:hypothetical protein
MLPYELWMRFYIGIGLMCYVVLGTLAAVEMVRISRKLQLDDTLNTVTHLNLAEQVIFNVVLIACCIIYYTPDYERKGSLQAATFYLSNLVGNWVVHIQVLLFFLACNKTDPFRSQYHFDQLMQEPLDADANLPAKKIGSPQNAHLEADPIEARF